MHLPLTSSLSLTEMRESGVTLFVITVFFIWSFFCRFIILNWNVTFIHRLSQWLSGRVTPNLTCPDEKQPVIVNIDIFPNFNLSIWASDLNINLSDSKIHSSRTSVKILAVTSWTHSRMKTLHASSIRKPVFFFFEENFWKSGRKLRTIYQMFSQLLNLWSEN